jgi:hypothetical protein
MYFLALLKKLLKSLELVCATDTLKSGFRGTSTYQNVYLINNGMRHGALLVLHIVPMTFFS